MFQKFVSALSDFLSRTDSHRQRRRTNRTILRFWELEPRILLDNNSIGPQGIVATGLKSHDGMVTLDGKDVHIGVVEAARPGKKDLDNDEKVHKDVDPTKVYLVDMVPVANRNVAGHTLAVTGVMISTGVQKGVSTGAKVYASSAGLRPTSALEEFEDYVLATQHLAITDQVKAVNHSYGFTGKDYRGEAGVGQGTSFLSLGLDWVASSKDVLNVIARGNYTQLVKGMGIPEADLKLLVPQDSYNGIVVGGAATDDDQGNKFAKVFAANTVSGQSLDGRNLTQILAPSEHLTLPVLDDTFVNAKNAPSAGSSMPRRT